MTRIILMIATLFLTSHTMAITTNSFEIRTIGEFKICFENFLKEKVILPDDFYAWEHPPKYWRALRGLFAGWMRYSPGSNYYAEFLFDPQGQAQGVFCDLNPDSATFGSCTSNKREGSIKLRWFWYDLPEYQQNQGQLLEFAFIQGQKIICIID